MFSSSPVFKFPADAKGLKRIAWYDGKTPLRSGWAWGQEHLDGGIAIAEAEVGKGKIDAVRPAGPLPRPSRTARSSSFSTRSCSRERGSRRPQRQEISDRGEKLRGRRFLNGDSSSLEMRFEEVQRLVEIARHLGEEIDRVLIAQSVRRVDGGAD